MKDPRKILLVSTIVILAIMFGAAYLRDLNNRKNAVQNPIQQAVELTPTVSEYSDWEVFRNGYGLPVPPNWKNTSDTGGRAVLEPGDPLTPVGESIYEMSATVLSDAKAPQGQQFTTQKEFDEWRAVTGEVQGNIQMLGKVTVDGEPGLMLIDFSEGEDMWTVIIWIRRDNVNLYINFRGDKEFATADAKIINYVVSNFVFNAPPSKDGGKGD